MPHYGMNLDTSARLTEIAIELEEMQEASEVLRLHLSLVKPMLVNTIGVVEIEARKAADAAIESQAQAEAAEAIQAEQTTVASPKPCRFPCTDEPADPPAVPYRLAFTDRGELVEIIYPVSGGVCQLVRYGHADKGVIHAKHRFAKSIQALREQPEPEFKKLCERLPYGGTGWDITPQWVKELLFKGWVSHD
jgi:hypothetical protein